jgi:hypothetical protein
MEQLTQEERDIRSRKRFYTLPMRLVIEAQKMAVSIDDACINALKQKIQEQKALLYVESFLNQPKPHSRMTGNHEQTTMERV